MKIEENIIDLKEFDDKIDAAKTTNKEIDE